MSGRRVVSGSVSGAIASFSFAVVHAILISEIWFSLPMLMIAGGICGACLGWAYGIMIEKPAIGSWLSFNVIFVGFFFFIAILSELVYEPMVHNDTLNDGPPPASL